MKIMIVGNHTGADFMHMQECVRVLYPTAERIHIPPLFALIIPQLSIADAEALESLVEEWIHKPVMVC